MAMWGEAKKTSLLDLMPIFTSLVSFAAELCRALCSQAEWVGCCRQGKVAVGLVVFGSGNPIIWFGAWWANRKRVQWAAEYEDQQRLAKLQASSK